MGSRPDQPTLAAVVRERLGVSWKEARKLCRTGRATVGGERETDPATRVDPAEVEVDPTAPKMRAGVLAPEALLHVDAHVAVVAKEPGVLTVPYDRQDKDTLADQLRAQLRRQAKKRKGRRYDPEVGVVHRLDKGTSGLLVFTRTVAAKRHLQQQFRERSIHRRYVALTYGHASTGKHDSWLIANRGDGLRGSWGVFRAPTGKRPKDARRAITHVLEARGMTAAGQPRSSLVTCRLETGRQHQIRIHLAEAGHPLVGEHVYIRDYEGPRVDAPRPMLHAIELGFEHPATGAPMRFMLPPPEDFLATLRQLGGEPPTAWRAAKRRDA
ncbi:MAG: ribosomal large subunit pseudouridine synthase D [Sandaracinus sp.]|nr:ribosomal large subunit pseudouridine synthase D [Myxococcales bacterium]MAT27650.1 ribosomal large subunit pseudouridine synthase D [Sandaracinus sp.]MBJ70022.1 ribosomal large subunit pseudouridine synthase D [Sandaracinus sp.]